MLEMKQQTNRVLQASLSLVCLASKSIRPGDWSTAVGYLNGLLRYFKT